MTNFEYYKKQLTAIGAYTTQTGEYVYNIGGGKYGTSAGRFIDWLYEEHGKNVKKFSEMTDKEKTIVINQMTSEHKCISDVDMLDFISKKMKPFQDKCEDYALE